MAVFRIEKTRDYTVMSNPVSYTHLQQPTTRMLPGSLWYPWYPSACSHPEKPCRQYSACSAFLVGWYSYSTMEMCIRDSHYVVLFKRATLRLAE